VHIKKLGKLDEPKANKSLPNQYLAQTLKGFIGRNNLVLI